MQIKIGPIRYAVEDITDLKSDAGTDLLGQIIYHQATIKLEADQHPQVKRIVLLHEIIHGILNNAGFQKHSEAVIDAIATGLMALIDDNPHLMRALQASAAPQE